MHASADIRIGLAGAYLRSPAIRMLLARDPDARVRLKLADWRSGTLEQELAEVLRRDEAQEVRRTAVYNVREHGYKLHNK